MATALNVVIWTACSLLGFSSFDGRPLLGLMFWSSPLVLTYLGWGACAFFSPADERRVVGGVTAGAMASFVGLAVTVFIGLLKYVARLIPNFYLVVGPIGIIVAFCGFLGILFLCRVAADELTNANFGRGGPDAPGREVRARR